jgi:hypothetical protein
MNDQLNDLAFVKHVEAVTRGERNYAQAAELGQSAGIRTRLALTLAVVAQRIQPALSWTIGSESPRPARA